jgi:hypothetical protein
MKLTPIKFDAQYADGILEIEGHAFEWNGIKFAVNHTRPIYRFSKDDPLSVSVIETGFGVPIPVRTKKPEVAAKAAIKVLDAIGLEKVQAAIKKSRNMPRPTKRLAA